MVFATLRIEVQMFSNMGINGFRDFAYGSFVQSVK